MTFLPIVERELRVASRRRGTYWSRFAAAAVALAVTFWVLAEERGSQPSELGKVLFGFLTTIIFIYAGVTGTQVTCDCLSEEKREGTLGLLFLTDLKGYDVVFGKLVASSLRVLYGTLAVMPILALPLMLGGVTAGEFWRVVLVALNLLFLCLAAGMFGSALTRSGLEAARWSGCILLVLMVTTPIICMFSSMKSGKLVEELLLVSPAYACFAAFDSAFYAHRNWFWINVAWTQVLIWFFLLMACRIVPRAWQDKGVVEKRGLRATWLNMFEGSPADRATRRSRMLEGNPYFWRAGRRRGKEIWVWIGLSIAAFFWLLQRHYLPERQAAVFMNVLSLVGLHLMVKLWIASEACRNICEDRRSGAMELLLSTPINGKAIVRGQLLALMKQFAGPIGAVLVVNLIFLVWSFELAPRDDLSGLGLTYLVNAGIFVMDCFAIARVGMWTGLRAKTAQQGMRGAVARIIVLPFIIGLGSLVFLIRGGASFETLVVLWAFLCIAVDFWFMELARAGLKDLRLIVSEK